MATDEFPQLEERGAEPQADDPAIDRGALLSALEERHNVIDELRLTVDDLGLVL